MSTESRLSDVEDSLRNLRNADRLQGRRFSAAKPSAGAVVVWNAAKAKWEPAPGVSIFDRDLIAQEVVSTTDETSIYSFEIPAGALGTTGGFRLRLSGNLFQNTGGALTIRVKLGGTTALVSNARNFAQSAVRHKWMMNILCLNSAVDAQLWDASFGAILSSSGITFPLVVTDVAGSIAAVGDANSAENTAGALTLDVTVQWSVSSADLSFRKKIALLELLPAA